ncbi:hypothetical protein FAZ19_19820 [Sphingobacterium alkalisoli]|uniref:DUF3127 domain-containing protein n=1 Tax=Sphingobacterium alkalisoli TaxID=1874115 RepID=A0A4V5LXI9_9SPHI|nr:hypothetical protein [Sphingobacterium alkalisoli]TJY62719.1 hypothetical protein FAZ19_19820 [Sphingobacterium alkalisoli]GGH28414.1 hypothetical protein GCM10011418_39070 [Sphingobacterium alkalisoli]
MATTTLKGIVKDVLPVETYNDGTGRKQTIVLFIPGYVDQWSGEKKGADEEWGVDIFNDNIEKHSLNNNCIDKKAEVEVYLKGKAYDKKDGSGRAFLIGASLKTIKLLESAGTAFKESATGDDGDLPF